MHQLIPEIMTSIPTLRSELLRHQAGDQMVVYDPGSDEVHLLDKTTSEVVEMLDQGIESLEIVNRLNRRESSTRGPELLELALDELNRARLMNSDGSAGEMRVMKDSTRREVIQRMAGLGAAFLIPAIITLSPRAASAVW